MADIHIKIPAMGEGITEATITKFLKNRGDLVEEDESIIEIATDKVDTEIPSPKSGIIEKYLCQEGDTCQVGDVIAIVKTTDTDTTKITDSTSSAAKGEKPMYHPPKPQELTTTNTVNLPSKTSSGFFLSPLVRSIAQSQQISAQELNTIMGSGRGKRITKKDILSYIKNKQTPTLHNKPERGDTATSSQTIHTDRSKDVEIIEMDRMRKLIAKHMVESKNISPHVTSFIDADITQLVKWREELKDNFSHTHGQKLTYTPIFIEAVIKALTEHPMINVSIQGDTIIRKKFINIGMATALPDGNLIVPVIKHAQDKNLTGLARAVNDLATRARSNSLTPEDIQGGTFTITNLGAFSTLTGTPIINQPQVAIIAFGAIKKRAAVIETPVGDTIGIRHIMIISLSYDHRVVDGALAGMFLKSVTDNLENFNTSREV